MWSSKKTTKKLFFNKYLNKVAIHTPLARFFRGNNLKTLEAQLIIFEDKLSKAKGARVNISPYHNRSLAGADDLSIAYKLMLLLTELKDYSVRVESDTLGVYFNQPEYIDKFTSIDKIDIEEVSEPDSEEQAKYLLENPDVIFRKDYTHKYKVTVKPLWNDSEDFRIWASKYDKIQLMPANQYKFGGHFYVADDKMLSLCRLYLANKLTKVEKLVTLAEI